jgi:hypothetical protein
MSSVMQGDVQQCGDHARDRCRGHRKDEALGQAPAMGQAGRRHRGAEGEASVDGQVEVGPDPEDHVDTEEGGSVGQTGDQGVEEQVVH